MDDSEEVGRFLDDVCRCVKYKEVHKDIRAELKNHLDELKDGLLQEGSSEQEAEKLAIGQMGDPVVIGGKLNQIHRPRIEWSIVVMVVALMVLGILTFNDNRADISLKYSLNSKLLLQFALSGLTIFFVGFFVDIKRLSRYCLPVFLVSGLLCGLWSWHYGGSIANGETKTLYLAPLLAVFLISLAGSVHRHRDSFALLIVHIALTVAVAVSLMMSRYSKWFFIIVLFLSVYLLLTTWRSAFSRPRKVVLNTLSSLLLAAVLLPMVIASVVVFNPENQREFFHGFDRIQFFGHSAVNHVPRMEGFSFTQALFKFGIIFAILVLVLLVLLAVRLFESSARMQDRFYHDISVTVCVLFVFQVVEGMFNELGFFFSTDDVYSNFPFLSQSLGCFIFNMAMLSALLSCYRRKDITARSEPYIAATKKKQSRLPGSNSNG